MKRSMVFLLAAVILLAGCGAGSTGSPAAGSSQGKASGQEAGKDIVDNLKTIGDIKQLDDDMVREEAYFEDFYACVIDVDGTLYRLAAELPEDVSKQIWSIDFEDEDRDEKVNELMKSLEITRKDNFSELIIPQEELDKLVGKTGQDLLDDGWYSGGYNLEDMEFWMYKDPFMYTVVFEGTAEPTEDGDDNEMIKDLKVKSVTYTSLGNGCEWGLIEE